MSVSSQQYADLAWHVYKPAQVANYDRDDYSAPKVVSNGVTFHVRAHVDNPRTGYQGTIYQRRDTGELVVAHRGTEFDREAFKDGALADPGSRRIAEMIQGMLMEVGSRPTSRRSITPRCMTAARSSTMT